MPFVSATALRLVFGKDDWRLIPYFLAPLHQVDTLDYYKNTVFPIANMPASKRLEPFQIRCSPACWARGGIDGTLSFIFPDMTYAH